MSSIGHFLRSSLPQSYSLCHAQQSTSTDSATKSKTNFLAWCIYDEFGDKDWQKPERDWSIAVDNVELTTDQLITTLRRKLNICEVDNWEIPMHLSTAIDKGLYNYKKVTDGRKQYLLWICWVPKAPPARPRPAASPETPTPITKKGVGKEGFVKQEVKEEVKEVKEVKKEVKEEPWEPSLPSLPATPTPAVTTLPKRPRVQSSEISTPPRLQKLNRFAKTRAQKARKAQQALDEDSE